MSDNPQPIIKKVKKGGGHGHHGGAWKVAYADFVTAMMAFFLLMWLLNATSEEQKRGISNYFGPVGMASGASGSGGVLGGLSISSEGSFQDSKSAPAVTMLTPKTDTSSQEDSESEDLEGFGPSEAALDQALEQQAETAEQKEEAQQIKENEEKKAFAEVEKEIRQALQEVPDIKDLLENVIVDQTPDGLRIQLVDQDKRSMFPSGQDKMLGHTKVLIKQVVGVIQKLPNKIAVSGYTDATPYSKNSDYSNWELSTDRANASRRELIRAGIPESRIGYVVGKADRDPLIKSDPFSPQNRRISIVLLNAKAAKAEGAPAG
ncbi:MAG: flagellar motor protein MotB [Alphaproteobacteria bacterium]